MAKISEAEFKAQIKSNTFSNAYLIYGEESFLKNHYVNLIKRKTVDSAFEDFNFHSFSGRDTAVEDILKDADLFPMMGSYNLVLVTDYPFDRSENEIKQLQDYFNDIPETTIIVFLYDSIEFPLKNKEGKVLSKSKKIETAFAKAGSVVELNAKSEAELVKILVSGFKKRGKSISPNDAKYLISFAGTDIQTLQNETDKISGYVKDSEITRDIIDRLATKSLQARVNDLSKAITAGNYDKAYSILNILFINETKPEFLLSTISRSFIDMYRVKCAKSAGKPASDIKNYFSYPFDTYINNAVRNSQNLSVKQIRNSLDVIMDADNALKSTSTNKKLIFEEMLVKLLMISKEVKYD